MRSGDGVIVAVGDEGQGPHPGVRLHARPQGVQVVRRVDEVPVQRVVPTAEDPRDVVREQP